MGQSILIVDNNDENRNKLQAIFKANGYKCWGVSSSEEAFKGIETLSPDILIVDMDLPIMNGLDFCRKLRNVYDNWTPIILISSIMDELEAVLGLELGADDYMLKPIREKELMARVKSIYRRGTLCCLEKNDKGNEEVSSDNRLKNGNLILDPDHFVLYKKDEPVDLTRKEYELLYYLFVNRGKALSRGQLMKELTGEEGELDERIIDVFISRIRHKIEPSRRNPVYVKTVRNIGYMMKHIPPTAWNKELSNKEDSMLS
ncbi:response regulator transcription factor [Evansella sp. AB-P1]|uniref:response regulator transcription factor n=1 Tax=Evansella sp. AB-P1 TaxID=3037653 RepID=UPI00241CF5DD|nr:response regulator transcription factor [Evansella sp. AB-P1]MDG5786832.1 response regulator transcription factor [Evansella sp. AB-P1]